MNTKKMLEGISDEIDRMLELSNKKMLETHDDDCEDCWNYRIREQSNNPLESFALESESTESVAVVGSSESESVVIVGSSESESVVVVGCSESESTESVAVVGSSESESVESHHVKLTDRMGRLVEKCNKIAASLDQLSRVGRGELELESQSESKSNFELQFEQNQMPFSSVVDLTMEEQSGGYSHEEEKEKDEDEDGIVAIQPQQVEVDDIIVQQDLNIIPAIPRKYKKWTALEYQGLKAGVHMLGTNWESIRRSQPHLFQDRSSSDLRDKWRYMVKRATSNK